MLRRGPPTTPRRAPEKRLGFILSSLLDWSPPRVYPLVPPRLVPAAGISSRPSSDWLETLDGRPLPCLAFSAFRRRVVVERNRGNGICTLRELKP
eukprot:6199360-Pyramimonas_sp.AAC.1